MITQFNITGKSGATITYKCNVRLQKYWRIQGSTTKDVTAEEYAKALNHFNTTKKTTVVPTATKLSFNQFLAWCKTQHAVAVA